MIEPIETEHLILQSMDTELLVQLERGDLEAAQRLVGYRIPHDFVLLRRPAVTRRLALIRSDPAQHPWMYRAILSKADGELVGHISFHHRAPDPDLLQYVEHGAELGYVIEPAHRRKGHGKHSAIAMMAWASDGFGVRDFVLSISPQNLPSLRLAESMGFAVIGEQDDPSDGLELVMHATIDRVRRAASTLRTR
ncbi:MAG: GNAT family N-acetyltransferase [Deltaproteobacteria bacterium]|nr:GNAT family N-acetyltransferase [Nannocystaceae bacterium]